METIKKMFLTYSANDEAKIKKLKEGIKFLAIKLHEKHKNEDLNRLCEGLKSLDRYEN